ncbi:low-density lipoprotein receptor-related protein 6-like [Ptychodera flava]|uniref:low-density lipoprotein receptor-related protein 6-like n=1 Tax=Ptychodera flava TaxID=63121 RepID=UPI003969DB11
MSRKDDIICRKYVTMLRLMVPLVIFAVLFQDTKAVSEDEHPRVILASHSLLTTSITYINGTGRQIYDEIDQSGAITQYFIHTGFLEEFKSLSFDYDDTRVFYSETISNAIIGRTLEGANSTEWTMYHGTSTTVHGICVDWLANNTYWTDAVYNWIKVSTFDGTFYRSLVTSGLDHPSGIVCDPVAGYLYWSDIGRMNKIERSSLAGEDRKILLDENSFTPEDIGRPIALTIDYSKNRLYWADSLKSTIRSLDLNVQNAKPVAVRQVVTSGDLFSLALDPAFGFFVTDRNNDRLHIVPNDVTADVHTLALTDVPNGVVFYSTENQPRASAPCENAGCNQLCVSDPAGHKCICTYGYQLQEDDKTCERDDTIIFDHVMIFYLEENQLCTFPANIIDTPTAIYSCFAALTADRLDLDVYGLYLFAIVQSDDTADIWRERLETDGERVLLTQLQSSNVQGIAVDWVASNLYITDAGRGEIIISSLDGSSVATLISSQIDHPTAIVVHPPKGYLFWTDTGANPRIERSDLSGRRDRKVLVNTGIVSPTHLVIDIPNDRIYWADGGTRLIESMELDGQGRQVFSDFTDLQVDPFEFKGLAIFQDLLYVTSTNGELRVFNIPNKEYKDGLIFSNEFTTMKFFHQSLQPLATGPCDVSNGDCDEICINTIDGAECVCSGLSCTPVFRCPLTIANGNLIPKCDNRNGHSCNFACNAGYMPAAEGQVTCTNSGEWSINSQAPCKAVVFHCTSQPCKNGGNCTETGSGFNCTCPPQWTGDVCDVNISDKEPVQGGSSVNAVTISVSVVIAVLLIVLITLLVIFRGKILPTLRGGGTLFGGKRDSARDNDYSAGAPSAPLAAAPPAPKAGLALSPLADYDQLEGADAHDYDTLDTLSPNAMYSDLHPSPAENPADRGRNNNGDITAEAGGIDRDYQSMRSVLPFRGDRTTPSLATDRHDEEGNLQTAQPDINEGSAVSDIPSGSYPAMVSAKLSKEEQNDINIGKKKRDKDPIKMHFHDKLKKNDSAEIDIYTAKDTSNIG